VWDPSGLSPFHFHIYNRRMKCSAFHTPQAAILFKKNSKALLYFI